MYNALWALLLIILARPMSQFQRCGILENVVVVFVKDWILYQPYIYEIILPSLNAKFIAHSEVSIDPDGGLSDLKHIQSNAFSSAIFVVSGYAHRGWILSHFKRHSFYDTFALCLL